MESINFNKNPNEYFKRIEKQIIANVHSITQSLLETFKFNFVYHKHVTEEEEKKTEKAIKDYRNKFWKQAMKEARGNKNKAYKIYTKNLTLMG